MKSILKAGFVLLLLGSFQKLEAQSELFGSWKATCPYQLSDKNAKATACSLCTAGTDPKMGTFWWDEMNVEIDKDLIKISDDKETEVCEYTWDEENKLLEFTYKKVIYKFKTTPENGRKFFTLKTETGSIVKLEKV